MAWMRYIYSFGLMLVILPCLAQYDFHNKPKIEKSVHVGGAYFYGDIGGRQKNALLLFGYEELDFSATKPNIGVGLKRNFNKYVAVKTGLTYPYLEQSDAKSYSASRHPRNLSFRTHILEASFITELRVAKFQMKTKRKKSHWEYYVFGGVGGFYYNPKAEYRGNYVALRPLSTEGQGLKPDTKQYSLIGLSAPIGGGLRFGYGFGSSFYCEMGYRLTNTDYIDDVSTSYYSREQLLINRGKASAALSYRGNEAQYAPGRDRGNRFNKDNFLLINIGFSTSLKSRKPTRFHGR